MTNKGNYWVYILHCENDTYYTGYTTDIEKRYQSHIGGTSNVNTPAASIHYE